jgi:hypothetical protein
MAVNNKCIELTEIRKKFDVVVVDVINVEQNVGVQCLFCRLLL